MSRPYLLHPDALGMKSFPWLIRVVGIGRLQIMWETRIPAHRFKVREDLAER